MAELQSNSLVAFEIPSGIPGKTKQYLIRDRKSDEVLGIVEWVRNDIKYGFRSSPSSVTIAGYGLAELARFIGNLNREYIESLRARREERARLRSGYVGLEI